MTTTRRAMLAGSAALATSALLGTSKAQAHPRPGTQPKPTDVDAPAAFMAQCDLAPRTIADGSDRAHRGRPSGDPCALPEPGPHRQHGPRAGRRRHSHLDRRREVGWAARPAGLPRTVLLRRR